MVNFFPYVLARHHFLEIVQGDELTFVHVLAEMVGHVLQVLFGQRNVLPVVQKFPTKTCK